MPGTRSIDSISRTAESTSRSAASASRSTEAEAASKGPFSNPGVLLVLALALLFIAYALGYLPQLGIPFGHLFNEAVLSSQHTDLTGLNPAVYGIAALIAFLILLAILRTFDIFVRKVSSRETFASRPTKSLEQFVEEAAAENISQRVARESFHLLFHHYHVRMSVDLRDDLRADLHLTGDDIATLRSGLLDRAGRSDPHTDDLATIITVHDLLAHVEAAPAIRKDRSGSRSRSTDGILSSPAEDSRPGPLTESRMRTREHIANLQRRAADYSGPRRRATDNRIDPEYAGPRRRSSDRPAASTETIELHSAQASGTQIDPTVAELNQLDPLFVPPRNKR